MTYQRIPIEILIDGQPHAIVDAPVLGELDAAAITAAERRAFWTIVSSQGYEPEQVTARYAPQFAEEEETCQH